MNETDHDVGAAANAPPVGSATALIVIGLVSGFVALLQFCLPVFSLQIFSRVIPTGDAGTLFLLLIFVSALICFQAVLDWGRAVLLTRLGVRIALTTSSMALGTTSIDQRTALLNDGDIVSGFLASRLARSVFDLPWTLCFVIGMYVLAPILGWMTIAALGVIYGAALLTGVYTRRLARAVATQASMSSRAMGSWEMTSSYAATVGLWMRQWSHLSRLRNRSRILSAGAIEDQTRILCLRDGLRQFIQAVLMGVTALLVIEGTLDVGVLVASGILFSRALAPHEQIVANFAPIISAVGAYRRIRASAPKRDETALSYRPALLHGGGIAVRATSVTVISREGVAIIDEIDVAVTSGQIVVISGGEGSGKTTLLKVLSGETFPTAGEVTWNDYPVAQIGLLERSAALGVLEEWAELGNGTIAQVISGHRTIDFQDIVQASQLADCHSQIVRLPDGYQTGVAHVGLSSSLRKRIALARAFLGKPRLICLDAPTVGLSLAGEESLAAALFSLKRSGCAIIIVTHSEPIMRVADRVVDLQDGRVDRAYAPTQIAPALTRRSTRPEETSA